VQANPEANQAGQNQVDGHEVAQQPWNNQDEYSKHDRNDCMQVSDTDALSRSSLVRAYDLGGERLQYRMRDRDGGENAPANLPHRRNRSTEITCPSAAVAVAVALRRAECHHDAPRGAMPGARDHIYAPAGQLSCGNAA
jgi:hypothetical protein